MSIHPEIAKILESIPAATDEVPDPEFMREQEKQQIPSLGQRPHVREVEQRTVIGEDGRNIPVRVYKPERRTGARPGGLTVYFHGGAFFSGSLETHDHVARALAKETEWTVISVGYRLAPDSAYPAGLEDCYTVTRWAAGTDQLEWDGVHLAVAGDSSGGNFVAAVAARAQDDGFDKITHQVLYYPSLDLDFDVNRYASLKENEQGYGLETAGLKPFNAHYVESGADPADPLVSPIKREDLTDLPPALVLTAQYDPLRDEGELYASRLQEAGVRTQLTRYERANHGFVQNFSWIPEFYRAFEETAAFLTEG
ncbi:alpha/beta hydrolase [Rothia uropygialis]|uniref:alpha/beta hydrolase n=1 Tax=Kocuria sp. 36 TaxID=1415402 RepID=UPI00101B7878|nr:alpha/beta hydrolase [Kocuria sp. 36]